MSKQQKPKIQNKKSVQSKVAPKEKLWLYAAALFAFAFVLYGQTIGYDYALDDYFVIKGNKFVQMGFRGIPQILKTGYLVGSGGLSEQSYRPVMLINLAMEVAIGGNNPHVGHFFNVLIYGLMGILLFLLLRRFFSQMHISIPFIIVLLYLAHPVHTDVTANIKGRDELLSFLLLVLSLYYLHSYAISNRLWHLINSLICYFISVMTKENGVPFLAVIPLVLYYFTHFNMKRIITTSVLYIVVVVVYLIIRSSILSTFTMIGGVKIIDNSTAAAQNVAEHLGTGFYILGQYIKLLFFPHPLTWDYSYSQVPIVKLFEGRGLLSLAIIMGLSIYAILRLKRKDLIAFGIIYFLATISLVANILITISATMGERLLYVPSLGFCIGIIFFVIKLLKIDVTGNSQYRYNTLYTITVCILLCYSCKTIVRNRDWQDNIHLFTAGVTDAPNSFRTHVSLGHEYSLMAKKETDPKKQTEWYNLAINQYKAGLAIYSKLPDEWYNLGYACSIVGRYAEAMTAYRNTIAYNAKYTTAFNNMGVIQMMFTHQEDSALVNFQRVIAIDSTNAEALENIGGIYCNKGNFITGMQYFQKAKHFSTIPSLTAKIQSNIDKAKPMLNKR